MEDKKPVEKEVVQAVQIREVATQTAEVFEVNGEVMDMNRYLCWLGNLVVEIKKGVSG